MKMKIAITLLVSAIATNAMSIATSPEYRPCMALCDETLLEIATNEMLLSLVKSAYDVNGTDDRQRTPLHYAVSLENTEYVNALLDAGAEINAQDEFGLTPFFTFIDGGGSIAFADFLLSKGADVDGAVGFTTLHSAAAFENLEVISFLLNAGANINAWHDFYGTPLHYAALFGTHKHAAILLTAGSDINARSGSGETPLHFAGSEKTISLFIEAGADLNAADYSGNTPLHSGTIFGLPLLVITLLNAGADATIENLNEKTPLELAEQNEWQVRQEYWSDEDNDIHAKAYGMLKNAQ